jgi:hypothetical protein
MALTAALIQTLQSPISNNTVYTSSASTPVLGNAITSIILCNTSGSQTVTVTLYAVPNSAGSVGSASATNMIVNALSIPPGETVSLDQEKLVLSNNDTIVAVASVGSTVSILISTISV